MAQQHLIPDLQRITQILEAAGRPQLHHQLGSESRFVFNDLLIPYRQEQLYHGDDGETPFINTFLKLQDRHLGVDHSSKHYRLRDNAERYDYRGDLGRSGRTIVDVVAIKDSAEAPESESNLYARKIVEKPTAITDAVDRRTLLEDFQREVHCLRACLEVDLHRHVVQFKESYTDETSLGILMAPIGDCNLRQFMDREYLQQSEVHCGKDDYEALLTGFFGCLLRTMEWLSSIKIRHRDVKPDNILIHESHGQGNTPKILICDFGLARDWVDGNDTTDTNTRGTGRYKAPELGQLGRSHDEKTDVWALGCVFVELDTVVCGHQLKDLDDEMRGKAGQDAPRERWSFSEKLKEILAWVKTVEDKSDPLSGGAARKELVYCMLKEQKDHRKTFKELVNMVKDNSKLFGECCSGNAHHLVHERSRPSATTSRPSIATRSSRPSNSSTSNSSISQSDVKDAICVKLNGFEIGPRPSDQHRPRSQSISTSTQSSIRRGHYSLTLQEVRKTYLWQYYWIMQLQEGRIEHKYWLPHVFVRVAQDRSRVYMQWSDYKQLIEQVHQTGGQVASTLYTWQHEPSKPNLEARLAFASEEGAKSFVNAVLNPEQTIHNSLFDSVAQQEFHRIKRTVLRSYRWPANGSKLSDSGRFILYSIERTTSDLRYLRKAFIPDHTDFEFNSDGIRPDMPSRVTFLRHYEPYYGAEQRAVGTFYEPHKITLGEPELRQGSSFSVYFSDASSNERDVIPKDCLELFLRLTDWRLVFACSFKKLSWKSSIIGQESGSGFVTIWQHPTQLNSKRLVFRYKSGHGNNNSGEYVWLASNTFTIDGYNGTEAKTHLDDIFKGTLFDLRNASVSERGRTVEKACKYTVKFQNSHVALSFAKAGASP